MNQKIQLTSTMSDLKCWEEIFLIYKTHEIGPETMAILEKLRGSVQSKLRVLRFVCRIDKHVTLLTQKSATQ